MKIGWKRGSRVSQPAQDVGEQLLEIYRKEGVLRPERVREIAKRKKRSPLGKCYNWDKDAAADAHWLERSYYILRSLIYYPESEEEDEEAEGLRMFVVVESFTPIEDDIEDGVEYEVDTAYEFVEDAMADPEKRTSVLNRALKELRAFRKKYKDLKELAGVFEAMDEI